MNLLLGKGRLRGRKAVLCLVSSFFMGSAGVKAAELEKEFVWQSFGEMETLRVKVPATLHEHYSTKARTYQYANYVKEDAGYELTAKLAAAFDRRAVEEELSEWEKINMVIDFVQSLQYQPEQGEYPKYPVETLKDGGGDCEDTSILLAAILDKMGIDCVLLSPPGHMALGLAITGLNGRHYLYAGRKYFYVETTGKNWEVGHIPDEYSGSAKVYGLPESNVARRAVTAHDIEVEAPREETTIMLAFYRAPLGKVDAGTRRALYRYTVQLETDARTLGDVQEVQYRRLDPAVAETGKNPWMRAYSAEDSFLQEWTSTQDDPVQVRIFFKDGEMVQTVIDFEARTRGD
jgi:hypothetical protein